MIRFRSFRATLLTVLLAAVAATQIAIYTMVAFVNHREARREIETDLEAAAIAFERVSSDHVRQLAISATAVARDYAFRQNFFTFLEDAETLQSAMASARDRIDADLNAWVDLDGATITALPAAPDDLFAEIVLRADESEEARATGYIELDGELYVAAAVPIYAPTIVAWWVVGTRVDSTLASDLHAMTGVDVSFANTQGQITASSLEAPLREALTRQVPGLTMDDSTMQQLSLQEQSILVRVRPVPLDSGGHLLTLLQYSLHEKLAPSRRLGRLIFFVSLGGIAVAAILGAGLARRLSRPVQALAHHTQLIAAGDYTTRLELNRRDELGDLAHAFNAMSTGLAERDQVRDLLDKNVSPEVAAELMREGAALGGEEREVTILFADLRGFTTFAEDLPARDVVAQLNRYLDRMTAAIESAGGVIDKFIGDEIMALFGAPVSAPDCAHRALQAAQAMRSALAELNREFVAESLPPLAFGIGINSARVIAGNIGSHRRLNYSVIGDGVNLAARLQALTRREEFGTDLILSESTLIAARRHAPYPSRDLGKHLVKGRHEPVRIYTLGD
ncbi:adenylate/guanylate cyclase domain-containing protein [Actomonas aquatica]|uniref:Adenylate/guanylate cyclase domain-containing protein n=1 Tax=Actomonas aquatica TaxID=2866162 RepID=A0ABZ1C4F9_9BACT|nr:adenylate/guanylate cyclase domain-containing protein [Opitutus sp. WL0086]WRQ86608.1 adenylate/guanylate cyclase domain-containing protein [Opitutus sp. WL0086]